MNPNFFIIGAPKCGTSSLASWLSEHENIYISPIKEPHFFSTDLHNSTVKSYIQYNRLFKNTNKQHIAIGEASTWYLYSQVAIDKIEKEYENVKYIVMTRDPVQMCQSLYQHNVRVLHEDQNSFERAWNLQELRKQGQNIPKSCQVPEYLQYYQACSLGSMLQRLYQKIPKERVLHISLDNMKENPKKEYIKVLEFLRVEDDHRSFFPVLNEAGAHRNRYIQIVLQKAAKLKKRLGIQKGFGITKFNRVKKEKETIPQHLKIELEETFKKEKELVEEFKSNG